MKLSLTLIGSTIAALLTPTLACVHATGSIHVDTNGEPHLYSATLDDNGGRICDSSWGSRVDQDNHFSINCVGGFIYAFTKQGDTAWYGTPHGAFSWHQNTNVEGDYCDPPEHKWCNWIRWDVSQYC